MKMKCVCLVMMVVVGISIGELPPPETSYKILMLLPVSSKSHRNVFVPLAEALADRGHKIVMLSSYNKPSKNPNIQEISHNLPHFDTDNLNMFEARKKNDGGLSIFLEMLPNMARDIYHVPQVKELYAKRKQFDLVITDHMFNELIYPFAHEMPFMTIATPGMDIRQSAVLGNPLNPAYVPNLINPPDISGLFGRLLNTWMQIAFAFYWRRWAIVPLVQKEISMQFPNLPPLLEIERNQSLTLLNSHFSMDMTLPLLPSQVEVGFLHCRSGKPLPENLDSWINGAGSAGVIYFNLGSVARGDTIPVQYRDMFIEAFKKMDQRVLWKFETDLEGVSSNVMITQWLPQQDILAHPNVKVFITHAGLLSIQEAAFHGMPLLALPIFGDQPKNGDKIVASGLGLSLVWEKLTVNMILEALHEVINNPKFRKNAATVSRLAKDQINTPKDRAVYWTEYVIRHKGAPKLRSPAASLSWVEFLLLDVLAILLLIAVLIFFFTRWILRKILKGIFGKSNKKKKKHE